jgi:branched-chain amino acid transport system substrate-binding protein
VLQRITASSLWLRTWPTMALVGLLTACAPQEPVQLGFLGGLSGRVADLGIGGRNGALLAVELRNKAGGINGRQIRLIAQDDQQDPEVAKQALTQLIDKKVVAIIGPMTSAMAVATVPLANRAQVPMVSPTATTATLSGLDDYFLRVIAPTTEYARKSAAYHFNAQGSRRVAVAFDLRNQAYTESWLQDYGASFQMLGGTIAAALSFTSNDEMRFSEIATQLLHAKPDSILIVANSVDTALLAQQLRKIDSAVQINTSEWAATERLIELGGKAIEGVVIAQFIDRDSQQPSYLAFRKAYLERFGQEPGFPGLTAFDATNVVLDALGAQTQGQGLKQAILARPQYAGAQSLIRFDANGDSLRDTYLTTIRNGTFVRLR